MMKNRELTQEEYNTLVAQSWKNLNAALEITRKVHTLLGQLQEHWPPTLMAVNEDVGSKLDLMAFAKLSLPTILSSLLDGHVNRWEQSTGTTKEELVDKELKELNENI